MWVSGPSPVPDTQPLKAIKVPLAALGALTTHSCCNISTEQGLRQRWHTYPEQAPLSSGYPCSQWPLIVNCAGLKEADWIWNQSQKRQTPLNWSYSTGLGKVAITQVNDYAICIGLPVVTIRVNIKATSSHVLAFHLSNHPHLRVIFVLRAKEKVKDCL